MEHCQPKRPGDNTGARRVWTDQGLARIGGDQPICVLVAGQTMGCGNKGIGEAERLAISSGHEIGVENSNFKGPAAELACSKCHISKVIDLRLKTHTTTTSWHVLALNLNL